MRPARLSPFEVKVYESAVVFVAFQFGGRGVRNRLDATTEAEALAAAGKLRKDNPANVRPVMIYAVDAAGNKAMIGTV